MSPDDVRELYAQWLTGLWHGDLDLAVEIVTDDFVGHWPTGAVLGPEGLAAVVGRTRAEVPGLTFACVVGPLVDGDLLAARWEGVALTDDGPLTFHGNDLMRIRDGMICEYWPASSAGA